MIGHTASPDVVRQCPWDLYAPISIPAPHAGWRMAEFVRAADTEG